jgi:hypothetical protein
MLNRTKKSSGIPPGTETEEWRLMSANIALAFWNEPSRHAQVSESIDAPANPSWKECAQEYRVLIRSALRKGEIEGIKFRQDLENFVEIQSKDWLIKTARLSWLMWLTKNRISKRVNQNVELTTWEIESENYRKYVRSVCIFLDKSNIRFES